MAFKMEAGRSMVEMLGVLAVIGVLSVGGIAGYSLAINKYKANEVVEAVLMAKAELITKAAMRKQGDANINAVASNVSNIASVSLGDISGKPKAYIKVDFGNNTGACKQFQQIMKTSDDYAVIGGCE